MLSDFEQRLRSAMNDAVADAQAPENLAELVRQRRRRHRVRDAVAVAAAVAAIAVGAVALHAGVPGSPGSAAPQPGSAAAAGAATPALLPPAVSRNVIDECAQADWSQLPAGWQRHSVQAGPLWLVDLRPVSTSQVKDSKARIGGLLVVVRNGATAWATVVGPADSYFRFLFGPNDLARGVVDGPYTISDGESGVTFVGCPSKTQGSMTPGYTQYGGYFLVTVPRACVTLDVWSLTGGTRARVTFPVGGARCGSS